LEANDDECQGQLITFNDLYRKNVTIDDLFLWQASIDVLNDYQNFLDTNSNGGDRLFCKCIEEGRFGTNCEYILMNLKTETPENMIKDYFEHEFIRMDQTCYRGPLAEKCSNNPCLDWRLICNSYYDCEMGEDERFCLVLEANTCRDDQYRCKNGLCIPLSFSFDFIYDCLDRSDEPYGENIIFSLDVIDVVSNDIPSCLKNPSIYCEEFICFNMSIVNTNIYCSLEYSTNPFESHRFNLNHRRAWLDALKYTNSLNFECWKILICLMQLDDTGILNLLTTRRCSPHGPGPILLRHTDDIFSLNDGSDIPLVCPNKLFVFPSRLPDIPFPSDVVFKFHGSEVNFGRAGLPMYVCYNGTWCDGGNRQPKQICRTLDELGLNVNDQLTYAMFYDFVRRFLFKNCRPPLPITQVCSSYDFFFIRKFL
jgi:hypothetical protein